jgi:hypothetical protein
VSRIAEACAQAGYTLPEENSAEWEEERDVAEAHLKGTAPVAVRPALVRPATTDVQFGPGKPRTNVHVVPDRQIDGDSELATAICRIFLSARRSVRSLLFCTVPGDSMSDVAWCAAELLAAQSGRRVAFVEDAANSVVPAQTGRNDLIKRISWYAPDSTGNFDHVAERTERTDTDEPLGEHVADLYSSFPFVIINATAPTADDLVPLAREVDGVVVVVIANRTRADAAEELVATLRRSGVHFVGAILAT